MPTPPTPPTLQSDTVVFTHAKLPSRQSTAAAAATRGGAWTNDLHHLHQQQQLQNYPRFRDEQAYGVDAQLNRSRQQQQQPQSLQQLTRHRHEQQQTPPRGAAAAAGATPNIVRLTVRVMKQGERLGFGIRHDMHRKLRVSTLQGNSAAANSPLRLGDILLSVNGIELADLSFLEVIQHLKAMRPGELAFDVERDLNASPNHVYEYPAGDLESGEEPYIGDPPSSYLPPPPLPAQMPRASAMASLPPSASRPQHQSSPQQQMQQRQQQRYQSPIQQQQPQRPPMGEATSSPSVALAIATAPLPRTSSSTADSIVTTGAEPAATRAGEPQRKRSRPPPPAASVAGVDVDVVKMEKTHKQVVSTLMLELKREKAEKAILEDKNNALRKRLQKMLIECDEVRVKASTEVAAAKESAKRVAQQLEKEVAAARAQLRLQDRGPSVARTDSILNDLVACKAQLDRSKRVEADRSAQLSARFNMENRHADREAHRVREKLVAMFRAQLRQAGKRSANPAPVAASGSSAATTVSVVYEGLRRLAFLKLFGFPHDLEQYTSPDFYSLAQIHRSLEHDEFTALFGNALAHEERTGLFIVALAPMDVAYDPNTERLSLLCAWAEQNTIRELARNFRF